MVVKIKHFVRPCFAIYLTIIGLSCRPSAQDIELATALKMAGENRSELQTVLDHYAGDSLRYRAARHLVVDMAKNRAGSRYSEIYDVFASSVYDSLASLGETMFLSKDAIINKMLRTKAFEDVWTHYCGEYGDPQQYHYAFRADLQHVSAAFLIENVDYAFRAWELPWSRKYTFDEFCRFILPYRYANESLSPWRKYFWDKWGSLVDSLSGEADPVNAAIFINEKLKRHFWGSDKLKNMPAKIRSVDLLKGVLAGTCEDQVGLGYAFMRAFGIATSEIIVPNWGYRGIQGHAFNVVLDPIKKKWVDFHAGDINPLENNMTLMPKAFLLDNLDRGNTANKLAHFEHLTDLTAQFTKTVDIDLALDPSQAYPEYAYLCVFNSRNWQPIMWGKVKNNQISFKNMGVGKVYLPVIYRENQLVPIAAPIAVDSTRKMHSLKAGDSNIRLTRLDRKYYTPDSAQFKRSRDLVGGRFQLASKKDFSDARTIYTIPELSSYVPIEKDVPKAKGRYVRFVFPRIERMFQDGPSYIAFLTSDNGLYRPLKGAYLSSEKIAAKNMDALFDNDLLSYVSLLPSDVSLPINFWNHIPFTGSIDSLWVGMDLGQPKSIDRISYCPRNDKNNVYPNLDYELFYWEDTWISLGNKKAANFFLEYENIPVNSLLLLKCHSEGVEERIFTLDNERDQIWW